MSSNVVGLRIMDVVIGRVGGWPGEPSWTDPTKAYIRSPYVFDYGFQVGPITYLNLPPVPLPSNPANAPVYITLKDAEKNGNAAVFADLTLTRWNDLSFVKVGVVIPGCSVVPWDAPIMGASGASHSPGIVPDPGSLAGTAKFLREDATWAVPPSGTGTVTNTSGPLTAHAVVVGNGTNDEKVISSLGTTTTVLHGNTSGDPSFGHVVEADLGLTDVTTANVSTSAHGFAPKAPNDATKFLDGTGAYSIPPSSISAVQQVKVVLSSAQILALLATPVTLVAAAGANKLIVPLQIEMQYRFATTPYTSGSGGFRFVYSGSPTEPITFGTFSWSTAGFSDQSNNEIMFCSAGAYQAPQPDSQNKDLQILLSSAITGGDGTIAVTVAYQIVDLT